MDRTQGIGGSDIAAIFGLNKYKSAYELFLEKRGELPSFDGNRFTFFGCQQEELVANYYSMATGKKVQRKNDPIVKDWRMCHIDRKVVGENRVLECKTASAWSREWGDPIEPIEFNNDGAVKVYNPDLQSDEVPVAYLLQCQWYMYVGGFDSADLAVLIGGNDFRIYHILPSKKIFEQMEAKCSEFWDCVKSGKLPEITTRNDVELLYPAGTGSIIASDAIVEAVEARQEYKRKIKELTSLQESVEKTICEFIGENDTLLDFSGDKLLTWKSQERTTFDSKKFKVDYPELYNNYIKITNGRVLR
jgi:putative phage-type endonuclease